MWNAPSSGIAIPCTVFFEGDIERICGRDLVVGFCCHAANLRRAIHRNKRCIEIASIVDYDVLVRV